MVKNPIKRSETYRRDFLRNNPGIYGIYFCNLCQLPVTRKNMHVDHIMPISKLGGTNMQMNLAPLCRKCNLRKSNKVDIRVPIIYARKFVGFLVSIPLKIIGLILETFLKLPIKMKLVIVAGIVVWAFFNGYISTDMLSSR